MKTFCIRFYTPEGRKQVAFSLTYSHRQALIDFLRSLQAGNVETIMKDAIIFAYALHGDRHETEALAYAQLQEEKDKTEFIYQAVLAYLPALAQKLVAEAGRIKSFCVQRKN